MQSEFVIALAAAATLMFTVFSAFVGILIRTVRRNTRADDKLDSLVESVRQLVADKEKVHTAILEQMRYDRDATDRRLRFMEEWFMKGGHLKP